MNQTITPVAVAEPIRFAVDGMSCASCVARVEKAAAKVPGVASSAVNLATEMLTVTPRAGFSAGRLAEAVTAAGYLVRLDVVELEIDGMSCASCVSRVERALRAVPSVAEASVNLTTERATVSVLGGEGQLPALIAAVAGAGYTAQPLDGGADAFSDANGAFDAPDVLASNMDSADEAIAVAVAPAAAEGAAAANPAAVEEPGGAARSGSAAGLPAVAGGSGPQIAAERADGVFAGAVPLGGGRPAAASPAGQGGSGSWSAGNRIRSIGTGSRSLDRGSIGTGSRSMTDDSQTAGSGSRRRRTGPGHRQAERRAEEIRVLSRDVSVAAMLTLPLFLLEMGGHVYPPLHHWLMGVIPVQPLYYLYFLLATVVVFGPGLRFFRKGIPALLRGSPEMNSLVALGAGAAYGYSLVTTFLPSVLPAEARFVYYEAAAVIVTLILLGRLLEARAKGRTGAAIQRLVGLQAKLARVERDGQVVEIAAGAVRVGDVVVIRPGEKLPVDGVVIDGQSFVDEAMLSGEPAPAKKVAGAAVTGGTINGSGSFRFRAEKVGGAMMLAQIIRLVEQAQGGKLPIQKLVDRVTGWFVPAVIFCALLTFAVWFWLGPEPSYTYALVNAVAVLIIACPCAMGLATPTSILVGTGRAAELGVLFRKGEALQVLNGIDLVVFDKTGTVTKGKPELTDLLVADGFANDTVLALAAALEARSEHPIGAAIVAAARGRGLVPGAVDAFEAVAGYGISGIVDGQKIAVGADRLMRQIGVSVAVFETDAARLGGEGKTPIYVAVDGKLAAAMAVADPLKPSSVRAIAALRQMGLEVALVSGDNRRTVGAIAGQLGIARLAAEVLPAGKVAVIAGWQKQGRRIAFVGDGINDAPALAAAETGIAVGTGTDVAIESADVVLVGGDLLGVVDAIAVSRATMTNIRQNLFWAFGYNVALVPLAAGLLYPGFGILLSPMIGAAAMGLSSVFVLGNALRLKRVRLSQREASDGSEHRPGQWASSGEIAA
jgi:Cu+-exporting ATPase